MRPEVRSGFAIVVALAVTGVSAARAAPDPHGAYTDGFLAFILKDRVSAPVAAIAKPATAEIRAATQLASLPDASLPDGSSERPAIVTPALQPAIAAPHRGEIVDFKGTQPPGTIVVDSQARLLYLVQSGGKATRYHVAVGKPGAAWRGVEIVSEKRRWPDWTPTPDMRRRRPGLPSHVAGGPRNPLGARALYLGSSMYRIHGTTDPASIGRAASSGCIRMLNDDVIELFEQVPVGTRVEVL
ncbi:L,D-transpeptidase catalytic domain [Methylobacterium sp. 190mf]|uniref:L,D-transpeptidase n=1 Tax=Methylobacterium sp. 190mf TaxID=1761798 RepID=UPI00089F6404|nr:L,D-transpeptidase [Methylobacterium sp. 190mf]SEG63728.1 L,D-transpeptidase catalytic domain [Methylobacterium sp. 190mf]